MNQRIGLAVVVMMIAGDAHPVRARESWESLGKLIVEAWAKVETLSASTQLDSERQFPDRNVKKLTTGSYVYLRDGQKELVRQELESQQDLEMTAGNASGMKVIPSTEKRTIVSDGETISYINEGAKGKKGAKASQAGSGLVIGGQSLLDTINKKGVELQVLPDSRFEGREAWVIQAIENRGYSKTSYLIDKEWGVLLQRVTFQAKDDQDVPVTTYTVSKIKVNGGDVSPSIFQFEFPPGLEVSEEKREN